MAKYKVKVNYPDIKGYLEYAHYEGIIEAENEEEIENTSFDLLLSACDFKLDHYEIEDYGNPWLSIIEIEEDNEVKEQILTDKEREYLRAVIKPFRNLVIFVAIIDYQDGNQWLRIIYKEKMSSKEVGQLIFPVFKKNTMYKGMTVNENYTLEELGL